MRSISNETDAGRLRDEGADRLVALQRLFAFPGQLHELPPHPLADRGQLDPRPARIASESDLLDAVILDVRVDHQPALRIGRADEPDAEALPRRACAAVAGDDVVRFDRRRARWRPDRERDALRVLNEIGRLVPEGDPDRRERARPSSRTLSKSGWKNVPSDEWP